VGAYGYPRASRDVDFLVGDEALNIMRGGIVSVARGVPIQVGRVPIDSISIPSEEHHLEESFHHVILSRGIPIAPSEILVYLKLKSPRRKDSVDIVEFLALGLDPKPVLAYLKKNAPALIPKFETLWSEVERGE
jgi:hypothetical protein